MAISFRSLSSHIEIRMLPYTGDEVTDVTMQIADLIKTPGCRLGASAQPRIKLRKQFNSHRNTFTVGCDYDLVARAALLKTIWRDFPAGGSLSLTNLKALEWRNTLLLPGIADAAMRLDLSASADLRTRCIDVRLKLGLRRQFPWRGISFINTLPLDGSSGRCYLDTGATLSVPVEIDVNVRQLCHATPCAKEMVDAKDEPLLLALDFDQLDLRLEF